ncbi:MAG: outer membrane beta-barrel protein [Bacteroidales bacterium]
MYFNKIIGCLLLFCIVISSYGENYSISGIVTDNKKMPVPGCSVIMRSKIDSLYFKGTISDSNGVFKIVDLPSGDYFLKISFLGYSSYIRDIKLDKNNDLGKIILQEKQLNLDEVEISASMVERFSDRKEYKLTNIEKDSYSSALNALEVLPKIQILDQKISTYDGKAVKVLINGIPSSSRDLSVISPSNILKIEYYTNPPLQFSNLGLGSVVNVITKQNQRGGVVGFNTQNALTTGFGNNVIDLKYNFGKSQIGVLYSIGYRSYTKRILNESIEYLNSEKLYRKNKIGKNSPYSYEDQLVELNYNNVKLNDYTFSTKVSLKSLNRRRSSLQDVVLLSGNNKLLKTAESDDKDNYLRPVVDIYFHKAMGAKQNISLNVVGTYYNSNYDYRYTEFSGGVQNFNTSTDIGIDKYSVIGDAMYGYRLKNTQLFYGLRYIYNKSLQQNTSGHGKIETNEIYTFCGLKGEMSKKLNYNISLGFDENISTKIEGSKYQFLYFRPSVQLSYFLNKMSELSFVYEVNTETPSIANLTNNPYYKDENYLFTGNPNLKPSNYHNLSLSYFRGFKSFVINAKTSYGYGKDAILPVFEKSSNSTIVESFQNLDCSQNLKASVFFQWFPWKNFVRFRLYNELSCIHNVIGEKEWDYTDFYVVPSVFLSYKRWGLQFFYQSERKVLFGQQQIIKPSMALCELSYKPVKNLSVAAAIRYPFYKAWKQSSTILSSDIISRFESERIVDNANMIYVNLVYNFSYGVKKNRIKRRMNNEDKDTGILNRSN